MFREPMAQVFEVRFMGQPSDATMIADSFESFVSGANPDFVDEGCLIS